MSEKPVLRQLIRLTMNNTQSVTGRNLTGIMLLTQKSRVQDLTEEDVKNLFLFVLVLYFPTNIDKYYRILTNIIQISYSLRLIVGVYNSWALCTIEIQNKLSLCIAPHKWL